MPRSCDAVEVDRNACERRPVVATAHPGTQLAAAVQGLGIVFHPGDTDAFAAAILTLAADKDLRVSQGQQARRYAVTHLDTPVILDRIRANAA